MDDRTRADRILDAWAAVAGEARPPVPRAGVIMRSRLPVATLAGAVVIVLAAAAIGSWLGRGPSGDLGGASPSLAPSVSAVAVTSPSTPTSAPSESPSPAPTTALTAPPTPTVAPTTAPCASADLAARIVRWEGAAGSRIATVELTNTGASACLVEAMAKPQLVDGSGAVLLNGKNPSSNEQLAIAPGDVLSALVSASNYCQSAPKPPVTVAFILSSGDRILATPESPDDATTPPCLGAGQPGTIEMRPWS